LGYRVRVVPSSSNAPEGDLLIALHARKTARLVAEFRRRFPGRPIVVVLTGTDVYRDLGRSAAADASLKTADAIVTLQPLAIERIATTLRKKARAVIQSARIASKPRSPRRRAYVRLCVLGHLRPEKDPLRAAFALRNVAREVPVEVVQAGRALDPKYLRQIEKIAAREPRYRYAGELSRAAALRLLASSDALVLSSRMEGGANVASEAIALGVPVLASRIDGNVGILGRGYRGYYDAGSTRQLAELIEHFARDRTFARALRAQIAKLRPLVAEKRERDDLRRVVTSAIRRCRTAAIS
jgi:putative glycosyltransferase (TIGR04348 family)